MSFRVVASVLEHSEERLARRIILLVLAEACHDDGVCFLGQQEIARKGRLSKSHVNEELKGLAADGALQVRKAQRGRRRIAVYRLNLPGLRAVDYDDLPFEVKTPFHDVGTSEPVTDDEFGSTGSTGSDPPGFRGIVPLIGNREGEPEELVVVTDDAVPKVVLVEGQNVAFNALAEVCGIDPSGNRGGEVGWALNGSKRKGIAVGIRELVWRVLSDEVDPGEEFEQAVADAIRARADDYRARMGDALLTPTALAKWWTDLDAQERPVAPAMKFGRRDVSAGELFDLADRLERGEIESATG